MTDEPKPRRKYARRPSDGGAVVRMGGLRVASMALAAGGPYVATRAGESRTTLHDPGMPRGSACAVRMVDRHAGHVEGRARRARSRGLRHDRAQ
jgi:hypothetical protein